MNCLSSGAIVRIGGVQKRADGVAGAKYSHFLLMRSLFFAKLSCDLLEWNFECVKLFL